MAYINVESRCVVDEDGRARNFANCIARGLPVLKKGLERTDKLAVVAAGPSVPAFLDEIKTFKNIWAVNGAYGYLIENGIVPSGFVGVDPLPTLSGYFGKANKNTTFYMSAQSDPSVFDTLKDYNVEIWVAEQTGFTNEHSDIPYLPGGTTAATRAPFVARHLGFRNVTLFGVDSSFGQNRYCYKDGTYPDDSTAPPMRVMCNGEGPFYSEICLVKQVSQLDVMMRHQTWGVKFAIRCGGLMDAYLRSPVEDEDGVYAA